MRIRQWNVVRRSHISQLILFEKDFFAELLYWYSSFSLHNEQIAPTSPPGFDGEVYAVSVCVRWCLDTWLVHYNTLFHASCHSHGLTSFLQVVLFWRETWLRAWCCQTKDHHRNESEIETHDQWIVALWTWLACKQCGTSTTGEILAVTPSLYKLR